MKTSKFFLSTLIAASAMTATAYAEAIELFLAGATKSDLASGTYEHIYLTNGTLNIVSGTVVETAVFRGTAGNANGPTTLNVESGATLTITGSGESINANENSFMLANYPAAGNVNVSGVLNLSCGLSSRDGTGTFTVKDGGVANFVSGMVLASRDAARMNVVLESGGRINIGERGIACSEGSANITLKGGTLGALDNWSTSYNLSATGTVTLNTTKYDAVNATYLSEGATIVANGGLSGEGKFIISGIGTVETTNISVKDLEIRDGATLALTNQAAHSYIVDDEVNSGIQSGIAVYEIMSGEGTLSGLTEDNLTVNNSAVTEVDLSAKIAKAAEATIIYHIALNDRKSITDVQNAGYYSAINVVGTLDLESGTGAIGTADAPLAVAGTGTIKYTFSPDNAGDSGFHLSQGFQGTLDWTGGFNWPGSYSTGVSVNRDVLLRFSSRSGKIDEMWGNTSWALENDVEFGSDYGINLGGNSLTFLGSVRSEENTTLSVRGTNTLTFAGGATLGGLSISGGTLSVSGGNASIATLNATGGTLSVSGGSLAVGTYNVLSGTFTFGKFSSDSFGEDSTINVKSGATVSFNLSDTGSKTFSGNVVLEDGAILKKFDGGLVLNDIQLGSSESDTVTILGNWFKNGTEIKGVLSGAGTAYFSSAGNANTNSGLGATDAERFTISGSHNTYSGTLVVGKSSADTTSGQKTILVVGADTALQHAKVNLAGGDKAEMKLVAKNVTIAGLDGNDGSKITGEAGSTLTINGGGTFAGAVAPGGVSMHLMKTGDEILTLSGTNNYSGGTTISAGTLVAGSNSALGTNFVKISGGKLEVSSGVTVSNNITVVLGDTLDAAVITGDGSLGGKITLDYAASAENVALALATEETTKTYTLLSGNVGSSLSMDFFELGTGWADGWKISDYVYNSETRVGTLTLGIPEPSAFGLLAGVGALALVASRRRRSRR